MKLLLGLDELSARSHYLNALLVCPPNSAYDTIKLTNPVTLDIVDDAECEDIVVDHLHEYVPPHFFHLFASNLYKKVGAGGTLTIVGVDLAKLCHLQVCNQIAIDEMNKNLYGDVDFTNQETASYPPKRSIITARELKQVFVEMGAICVTHRFNGVNYILTFMRG